MRRALLALALAACGGSELGADGGLDGAGDPCAAPSLSIEDFYVCRSRLTCALLEDCRATDTRHLDCDDLPHEQFGTSPQDRLLAEDSIAAGRATWDGARAAACLATIASRACQTFELPFAERMACSGAVGLVADGAGCNRELECASDGGICGFPVGEIGSCATAQCLAPPATDELCVGFERCGPGDHCVVVPGPKFEVVATCRSGVVNQPCLNNLDCDLPFFCLTDGVDPVGRCFPARAAGDTCHDDRECAGELGCVGETDFGAGHCRDLRVPDARCDDILACFGRRFCARDGADLGVCQPMPLINEACVVLGPTSFCGTELVCDGDNRCVAPGRRGDRCAPNESGMPSTLDCNRGLFCDTALTGAASGTCRSLQPELEQCADGRQCASGLCDRGVCTAVPACGLSDSFPPP